MLSPEERRMLADRDKRVRAEEKVKKQRQRQLKLAKAVELLDQPDPEQHLQELRRQITDYEILI
jgi:hypothetical protein